MLKPHVHSAPKFYDPNTALADFPSPARTLADVILLSGKEAVEATGIGAARLIRGIVEVGHMAILAVQTRMERQVS
jgi:hypothetical protein